MQKEKVLFRGREVSKWHSSITFVLYFFVAEGCGKNGRGNLRSVCHMKKQDPIASLSSLPCRHPCSVSRAQASKGGQIRGSPA